MTATRLFHDIGVTFAREPKTSVFQQLNEPAIALEAQAPAASMNNCAKFCRWQQVFKGCDAAWL